MEDLQKQITILSYPQDFSIQDQNYALQYCQNVIENNYKRWGEFINAFLDSSLTIESRFWMVSALIQISDKYLLKFNDDEKQAFYNDTFKVIQSYPELVLSEAFVRNKFVVLMANIYQCCFEQAEAFHENMIQLIQVHSQHPQYFEGYSLLLVDATREQVRSIMDWENKTVDFVFKSQLKFEERSAEHMLKFLTELLSIPQISDTMKAKATQLAKTLVKNGSFQKEDIISIKEVIFLQLGHQHSEVISPSLDFMSVYFSQAIHQVEELIEQVNQTFMYLDHWKNFGDSNIFFYSLAKLFNKILKEWKVCSHQYKRMEDEKKPSDFYDDMRARKHSKFEMNHNARRLIKVDMPPEILTHLSNQLEVIFNFSVSVFQKNEYKVDQIIIEIFEDIIQFIEEQDLAQPFTPQIKQIIQLLDAKVIFPEHFKEVLPKKREMTEMEEEYLKVREQCQRQLSVLIQKFSLEQDYINLILNEIGQFQQLEPRRIDKFMLVINILVHLNQSYWKHFEILIFEPSILECNFYKISESLIMIFQNIPMVELNESQLKVLISYLCSGNGILSESYNVYTPAIQLFFKEFEREDPQSPFSPFISEVLAVLSEKLFNSLDLVAQRSDKFNMNIFQLLGMLMCRQGIDPDVRIHSFQKLCEQIFQLLQSNLGNQKRLECGLVIFKHLIRGTKSETILESQRDLAIQLQQSILQLFNSGHFSTDNSRLAILLFKDKIETFGFKLCQVYLFLLESKLSQCDNMELLAEIMWFVARFKIDVESQKYVLDFVMKSYPTLIELITQKCGNLTVVSTSNDQDIQKVVENCMKLINEALAIDYGFIFSNSEECFQCFINYLLSCVQSNFTIKIRVFCIKALYLIFMQFFEYQDQQLLYQQSKIRQELQYTPLDLDVKSNEALSTQMYQFLEKCSMELFGMSKRLSDEWEDFYYEIAMIQQIYLSLDIQNIEKMRYNMKNVYKYLYSFVLDDIRIQKKYANRETTKKEMQAQFVAAIRLFYEEVELRSIV